jgi:hypothetical protein
VFSSLISDRKWLAWTIERQLVSDMRRTLVTLRAILDFLLDRLRQLGNRWARSVQQLQQILEFETSYWS